MPQKNQPDADELTFERGSGNVFADLGLDNADELLVKADLAIAIKKEIRARGWTQMEAAKRTGLTQSDLSRIGKMNTDGFPRSACRMHYDGSASMSGLGFTAVRTAASER